ncbi:hypothetical protein OHS33_29585 [Streptomyces sp. NBC_00536]|uniref:hypothetical protein n=1 Tax=Streptomyces sp. NBC_00536 TaxID=2975769 RepID=UPI002E805E03|nr:hypothetical protein [Streptomyces sp. NBC_00536]WUC82139.1 hypothetical protein OHS33_29585 [Streptomyces sp. NBC_00536]
MSRWNTLVRTTLPAPLLGLLVLLPLAGCGIKPTGVVESGRAASVGVAAPPGADLLYFVAPDGRLAPTALSDPRVPTGALLARLLAGPGVRDRDAGLTTALPPLPARTDKGAAAVVVPVRVDRGDQKQLLVRLPFFRNAELSDTGRNQLVCTAALSADRSAKTEVVLVTADGSTAPLRCELAWRGHP